MQHRVSPFTLSDPTQPGHRKLLALFLVDPGRRIISTAYIPPQQQDWWWSQIRNIGPLKELPEELKGCIRDVSPAIYISMLSFWHGWGFSVLGDRDECVLGYEGKTGVLKFKFWCRRSIPSRSRLMKRRSNGWS